MSVEAVYVISIAAELSGMHPQTLRMYEQRGLLSPARTQGGSRRYSDFDIEKLRRIQELTNQGITLEGVRRIIQLEHELDALHEQVAKLKSEIKTYRQNRGELVPFDSAAAAIFRPKR
jgi:MerR family transcriptional regulator/heat shock protein HspR